MLRTLATLTIGSILALSVWAEEVSTDAFEFTLPPGWVVQAKTADGVQMRPPGSGVDTMNCYIVVRTRPDESPEQCAQKFVDNQKTNEKAWMESSQSLPWTYKKQRVTIQGLSGIRVDVIEHLKA